MKKVLLSLVMVVLTAVSVNAQAIYGYGFSINEESYTALTDATVIASGTDEALKTIVDEYGDEVNNFVNKLILPSGVFTEEVTAAGYPIGFDFNFNYLSMQKYQNFFHLCSTFILGFVEMLSAQFLTIGFI